MHLKLGGKLPRFKGKSAKVPGERPGYLVTYPSYVYTSAAEHNDMTVIDSQPHMQSTTSQDEKYSTDAKLLVGPEINLVLAL